MFYLIMLNKHVKVFFFHLPDKEPLEPTALLDRWKNDNLKCNTIYVRTVGKFNEYYSK